jgi:hypothetical protein
MTVGRKMQNYIRLDDLLARDLTASWYEGVAVVQLVCRQLLAPGSKSSGFPGSADILVGPGGLVRVAGDHAGDPVHAAAHVLAVMLSDDAPVRLRLAVSQATAASGGYRSLTEFSEALAYFARPQPETIVEALRQRAMLAAPRAPTPPKGPVEVAPAKPPSPPAPVVSGRPVSRLPVIAATVAATVCGCVWLIGRGATVVATPDVKVESSEESSPDRLSTATSNSRPNSAAATAIHPAPRPIVARTVFKRPAAPAAPELQVTASTLSYAYPDLAASLPSAGVDQTIQIPSGEADASVTEDPTRIYSKADFDVTLPLSVYPKLPPEQSGVDASARTILELTIAANGLVERVRMLTAPRNVHEFMLLSAAKAWRFEPARIGDRAVRFRQLVVLTAVR